MKSLIDCMVDRFLGWKLPPTFSPDAGVKFVPPNGMSREEAYTKPGWWPVGTNLLTADEARTMFEHAMAGEFTPELNLRELDAIGRAYFNGPLNSNEEMFGRAIERVVRQRLVCASSVRARCKVTGWNCHADCPQPCRDGGEAERDVALARKDALLRQAREALNVATTPLATDRQEVLRAIAAISAELKEQDGIALPAPLKGQKDA